MSMNSSMAHLAGLQVLAVGIRAASDLHGSTSSTFAKGILITRLERRPAYRWPLIGTRHSIRRRRPGRESFQKSAPSP